MLQLRNITDLTGASASIDCIIAEGKMCWYGMDFIVLRDLEIEKEEDRLWLYRGEFIAACAADGKIYFAPMAGNRILVLDINTKKMDSLELPNGRYRGICNKIYQAKRFHDSIYFLPGKYPCILECVPGRVEVKEYALDMDAIGARLEESVKFCESSYFYGNRIFLASANNGKVCAFNVEKKTRDYYHIADCDGFTSICGYGDKLYLADKGGISTAVIKEGNISISVKRIYKNEQERFRKSICWGGKVMMFMEESEEALLINPKNDSCEKIVLFGDEAHDGGGNIYREPKIWNDKLYIFHKSRKTLIIFDENLKFREEKAADGERKMIIDWSAEGPVVEGDTKGVRSLEFFLKIV